MVTLLIGGAFAPFCPDPKLPQIVHLKGHGLGLSLSIKASVRDKNPTLGYGKTFQFQNTADVK